VRDGDPAQVPGAQLKPAVVLLAIACLLAPAYPGQAARHYAMRALGGVLVRAGLDAEAIKHLVGVLAREARDDEVDDRIRTAIGALELKDKELPGLPRLADLWGQEAADTLGKWLQAEGARKSVGPGGFEDTIALQFAEQHGGDYRYVAKSSLWLHWNGECWREEPTYAAFDLARGLCRAAGRAGDARAKTVAGVVNLARTDRRIAARIDQWDRDPDLLCCGAVTVDLRTGETRAPVRTDYCTKQTAVAPAPPRTSPDLFLKFLDEITNKDDELISFYQRYFGYCLTGHVHEHVLAFLHGTGANGKGTFLRTIGGIFGDYCVTSPIEMFLLSKYDRHPTEIARLRNARLTIAQETPQGRSWDEAKIKNLTGGDVLSARFMRGDLFDFLPTHKLNIAGNHKPHLRAVDEAIRRRLLLFPFLITVPKRKRDPELSAKLQPEWPAILRWMIDGCLEWHQSGLGIPNSVRTASDEYFAEQDDITQWLEECTERKPRVFTSSNSLFKSWQRWCVEHGGYVGTKTNLTQSLIDRGLEYKPTEKARGFINLVLKNVEETQLEADLG
jgi:P4 family phage/plasmid primase-like protien